MATAQSSVRVAVTQAEPAWLNLSEGVARPVGSRPRLRGKEPSWLPFRVPDPRLSSLDMDKESRPGTEHRVHEELAPTRQPRDGPDPSLCPRKRHRSLHRPGPRRRRRRGQSKSPPPKDETDTHGADDFRRRPGRMFDSVLALPFARVGHLSWEHIQPLRKYYTYSLREQIHIAAWPPVYPHPGPEFGLCRLRVSDSIPDIRDRIADLRPPLYDCYLRRWNTENEDGEWIACVHSWGGSSAVFGPDGRRLTLEVESTVETILNADLDMDQILVNQLSIIIEEKLTLLENETRESSCVENQLSEAELSRRRLEIKTERDKFSAMTQMLQELSALMEVFQRMLEV
ncbi:hypothetical protein CDV55_107754 [Aspergillus turcosus]|nr:hypothetical protein CDV55_107754 [Aspergillus turcosus]